MVTQSGHGCLDCILYTAGLVLLTDILRFLWQVTLTSFWCCWSWVLRDSTLSLVVSSSSLVADATLFFSRAACWACCNWSAERIWMKYIKNFKYNHFMVCLYLWTEGPVHLLFVLLQLRLTIVAQLLHPLSQFTLKVSPSSWLYLH